MTLTTPLALLGLLSLPAILALHMLRSRSQRYVVSSLSLWRFLDAQVRGSKARRIPLTWLLILDLLIAALLSLSLAGPRLTLTRPVRQASHTIVLLDVSTSMAAEDESPTRLVSARSDIASLLSGLAPQDIFTLITFGPSAQSLADSRRDDTQSILARLNETSPGGAGANLEAAFALAEAARDPEIPAEIQVFTDAAFHQPSAQTRLPVAWHLYGSSSNNQAILSLAAHQLSTQKFQVFARFANFSEQAVTRRATLFADQTALSTLEISLEPGTSLPQTWDLVGLPASFTVVLEGEDDLPADDRASTGILPGNSLSVALVADQPGPLARALEAAPNAKIQVIRPEDYLPGSVFDLTVFGGYLPDRWPAGSVLVADPPEHSALLGPAALTGISAQPFPQPDPLLVDVDFTGVRWTTGWSVGSIPEGLDPILQAGQLPLILRGQVGLSHITLLLPQIAGENGRPSPFARHPAFPVLVANAVSLSGGASFPEQIPAGSALVLPSAEQIASIAIQPPGGVEIVEFGADRPPVWHGTQTPGLYSVTLTDLEGGRRSFTFGVNAGDLAESNIAPAQSAVASDQPSKAASTVDQPLALTPYLLGLVAILLLWQAWLAWR